MKTAFINDIIKHLIEKVRQLPQPCPWFWLVLQSDWKELGDFSFLENPMQKSKINTLSTDIFLKIGIGKH